MKDKILTLIIGILIGAIVTSAGFVIYIKASDKGRRHDFGAPPQMNQSQKSDKNRGTPPDIPNREKASRKSNSDTDNNANVTNMPNNEQTQTQSNT